MLRLVVLHRIGDLAGDGGKEDEAGVLHLADGERQRGEGREGGLVDSGREEDELDELPEDVFCAAMERDWAVVRAWPTWREPVTLGGGIMMVNRPFLAGSLF